MRVFMVAISLVLFGLGCGGQKPGEKKAPSSVETAVDGFTGKTAVNSLKHARKTVDRVQTQQQRQIEELDK